MRWALRSASGEAVGETLIDPADVPLVEGHWWCVANGYATTSICRPDGKWHSTHMHRVLLGLVPFDGVHVDHVNRDRLDNQRNNLRVVTQAENNKNKSDYTKHSGLPRGVYVDRNRFRAKVRRDGRLIGLGSYRTSDEAAAAVAEFVRKEELNGLDR